MFWFFLICRIAVRFILYKTADDDRSEYEPSEEESEERKREVEELKSEFNGTANGAQGVLAEATATPDRKTTAVDDGSIGARVKQRNGVAKS